MDCSMPASLSFTISWSLLKLMCKFAGTHVSRWCHPTISSSATLFPFAFNLSQHQGLFQWVSSAHSGSQSIRVSASASVLPVNFQGCFPLGLTGFISLQSNGLSRVFSSNYINMKQLYLFQHNTFIGIKLHSIFWVYSQSCIIIITTYFNIFIN